jgi:hypothetical protein
METHDGTPEWDPWIFSPGGDSCIGELEGDPIDGTLLHGTQ